MNWLTWGEFGVLVVIIGGLLAVIRLIEFLIKTIKRKNNPGELSIEEK